MHLPQATVLEALTFSATLRLPSTVPRQTRDDFIEEVSGHTCVAPELASLLVQCVCSCVFVCPLWSTLSSRWRA